MTTNIEFNPAARRGEQYAIIRDGATVARLSRADALATLQGNGLSIRESAIRIAAAKLSAHDGTTVAPQ